MLALAVLLRADAAVLGEFSFEYREGLLWVHVDSPQSVKPLNFLFDTGAGVTTLNVATAKRLGMRLGRRVPVQGVRSSLNGHWQQGVKLKAAEVVLPDECLALDLGKLSRSCERPVDGLIGADFVRNRVVEIDFAESKIRVVDSVRGKDEDDLIPLEVRRWGVGVPITVNQRTAQLVRLDTGCATALQWVTSDVPDRCTTEVAIGLSEVAIPQTTSRVSLGSFRFEQVPTGLHRKSIFPGESGLLGNGLLSRFSVVTIDAKDGRLFLRKGISAR